MLTCHRSWDTKSGPLVWHHKIIKTQIQSYLTGVPGVECGQCLSQKLRYKSGPLVWHHKIIKIPTQSYLTGVFGVECGQFWPVAEAKRRPAGVLSTSAWPRHQRPLKQTLLTVRLGFTNFYIMFIAVLLRKLFDVLSPPLQWNKDSHEKTGKLLYVK